MRIVAVITERSVITKILAHLAKVAAATATEGSGPGPPHHPPPGPAPDPSVNRNPRQQAGAITGPGEACSNTHNLQRKDRERSVSCLAPCAARGDTALLSAKIAPESSASMGKERQAWNFALRGVKREMLFPIPIPDSSARL